MDLAELLWYNQIYHATFNTSASGVIFAVVLITLPSGLSLRAGDAIPPDVAELYVQHVQDTTQHARRQEVLSSFIAPAAKAQKLSEDISGTHTSRRRRQASDEDDKLVSSYGDERSVLSSASDSGNRRGLDPTFNTPDPLDKSQPMPSLISNHQGQFPFRREHINANTSIPECLPTIVSPTFFRLDPSLQSSHTDNITVFDKKRPFTHSDKEPYRFNHLSWKSYRVQMGDLIAHWRGGLGAEDVLLWPC